MGKSSSIWKEGGCPGHTAEGIQDILGAGMAHVLKHFVAVVTVVWYGDGKSE